MNKISRIFLFGTFALAVFPMIQAAAQEPDIKILLSAERSSFISGKEPGIFCAENWETRI